MLTGRKYRLKLTPEQEAMCEEFGNICRAVWNTALEQRREYARRGAWMNFVPQSAEFTEARAEFEWLRKAPRVICQQVLRDLDQACRRHGTFKVRWRSKARWSPSFRFPDHRRLSIERLNRKWGRVKLPTLGWVTFRWTRPLGGEIRSATVACKAGHWYVSFLVEDGLLTPEHHAGTPVGIDRGVAVAATTSAGRFYDREFIAAREKIRYRRLQQRLARSKKGSANRRKTIAAINRIMSRVSNRRGDFAAWTANRLTAEHSVVILEDLRTCDMTASAKGTKTEPGRNVRQKAGLNRAILDKGWRRMELALQSAARYTGTQIIKVNPAYTSQTCNRCKEVDAKSRESQAVFVCTSCGHRDHADLNAARNILAAGLAVTACGDFGTGRSAKQEPAAPQGVTHQLALPLAGIPQQ
ncbi:transposase [Streptomyces hygroscopicus]|uniref:RNA-guided endonuclease InsQ/TnpB family protein n=1 Tax=Streptomyces hygroscopicus TaxID=1912 RepID=UPI002240AF09|nr:transposase [Streptomyces hygroscopicus]MCW7941646.1 transposase [Streptomyces hygroscopicus]